ncbi:MAG: secretin N-terminal domain-containing protein [Acidobacteriota bacterium]
MTMIGRYALRLILAASLLTLMAACATSGARNAYRQAEKAAERELWDQAVLGYAKAVALEPGDTRYKVALARAKLRAATEHFDRGKRYLASGQLELATAELQEAVILDPSNQYATTELQKANEQMQRKLKGPSDMERAQTEAKRRAQELGPPRLNPKSRVPIVLRLPDATIEDVYEAIGKISGINVIYDEKVDKKKKMSVELAGVTFDEAMDIINLQAKHFYKVLDSSTIVIADDNRQKRTEYEDHVIRTFYLSNAETKDVQTLLRALLESRRIAENANLNAITIKDTPEKIKVAERIIKANDKAKGEVVVDLELLEITHSNAQKLGFDLSSKSLQLVFGDGKESVPLNNLSLLKAQSAWSLGTIPSIIFDFLKTDTDTKSIAKPSVRILEGENGKVTIGDRVPIPATTFNSSQTVGGNIVPVTSFTYQNVGIIIDIKPRVHHNKEITLEMKIEVSSLAGNVEGTGGVSQPIIGTRSVETTIRLRDGETNIIAGLVREDERQSLSGVPWLSDIPLLRRLFGTTRNESGTTDIVLALTPHIIRTPNIEPIDLVPLWVGTEEQIELRGVARNALGESPFADGDEPWNDINNELNADKAPLGDAGKTPQVKMKPDGKSNAPSDGNAAPQADGSGTPSPPRQPRRRPGADPAVNPPPVAPPPVAPGNNATPESESADEVNDANAEPDDEQGDDEAQPKAPIAPAMVRLNPERPQVRSGEGVGVDVLIQNGDNVGQVNFQLRYNAEVLRFVPPGEPGDFLAQNGVIPDVQVVEGGEGGVIVVSLTRPGEQGANGGGRLLRLNFVALRPGTASFQFATAQVRDPDSNALPAGLRVVNVEVAP